MPLLIANRAVAAQRAAVIAVTPALQERAYTKTAALTDALAGALDQRGTAPSTAKLAAQIAIATFDRANRQGAQDPSCDLRAVIAQAANEVKALATV